MNSAALKSGVRRVPSQRLDILDQYEVLGVAPDPAMEELTELAAKICNTPIAGVIRATLPLGYS